MDAILLNRQGTPRARSSRTSLRATATLIAITLVVLAGEPGRPPAVAGADNNLVRIGIGAADSIDPARQGDIDSAAISAQLFETLTGIDAQLETRPALAESWDFRDGGATVAFHLRRGLTFSDGSPLRAADVVRSWFRIIDPAQPSPLLSLIGDVSGALAYARRQSTDRASVGLSTENDTTVVARLTRPASDFPTIVAGPTFAIVPSRFDGGAASPAAGAGFVGSGGYTLTADTLGLTTLKANDRYWAGRPAIGTIQLVHDLGGRSPIAVFEDGDVDLTGVFAFDATWLAYDTTLGPLLRRTDGLSLRYYGFDTSRPPFNDIRVRQAFARAVDWRRLIALDAGGSATAASGMVPPGVPGRSDADFLPAHDPAGARALLADAGYPGGRGLPAITMIGFGTGLDRAFVAEVKRELGVTIQAETMGDGYFDRLEQDPPAIWSMGWVADYPGPNAFLGILLGSGSSNNYGRWSSPEFDRAIADALAATDKTATRAAFDRAEGIVRDQVPTIPLSYDVDWTLARTGLLGGYENGMGILRMAGLAWQR